MTPDRIKIATITLAKGASNLQDARLEGAALGRALAAEIRARDFASRRMNGAAALDMELALLKLAAGQDELVAEIADSALHELQAQRTKS